MPKEPTSHELQERIQELEQAAARGEALAETVLDTLSAHIAILNKEGWIVKTNRAWREFAQANDMSIRPEALRVNYLAVCDQAQGDSAEHAQEVARGIRSVIAGEVQEFLLDYPCHSLQHKRWFYLRARRLQGPGPLQVVISHENITPLKEAEEALKHKEQCLAKQTQELQEANAALRAVLRQREVDRREVESNVLDSVRECVLPSLRDLAQARLNHHQQSLVQRIEDNLKEITTPFARRLSHHPVGLTPQEIKVATCLRQGMSSKEIAQALLCSEAAVQFHRKNLRFKLGLTNTATNLSAYLQSLSDRED